MYPEQRQAAAYLQRKGTDSPLPALRQRVDKSLAELEAVLAPIDTDTALHQPGPGKWSIHEIVDHLVESHRPAVTQLRAMLTGGDPGDAIPAGLTSTDPFATSWPELVRQLKEIHDDIRSLLTGAAEQTPTEIQVPVAMLLKVKTENGVEQVEWKEHLDWKAFALGIAVHSREHIPQIQRTLDTAR